MIVKTMPARWEKYEINMVVFDNGDNRGFMFPCDKDGKLDKLPPDKKDKYEYCISHPDLFDRFNEVIKFEVPYEVEPKAECECGNILYTREIHGKHRCRCGRWYDNRLNEIKAKCA